MESVESVNAYQPVESIAPVLSYIVLYFTSGREATYRVSDYSRELIEELYQKIRDKVIDELRDVWVSLICLVLAIPLWQKATTAAKRAIDSQQTKGNWKIFEILSDCKLNSNQLYRYQAYMLYSFSTSQQYVVGKIQDN